MIRICSAGQIFAGAILLLTLFEVGRAQERGPADVARDQGRGRIRLIVRVDDIGFCHATNEALRKMLEASAPITSVSCIVNTGWFAETAGILKSHPRLSVGCHCAINAEWREFRWGPVAGATTVPSLVDEFGYFWGSRRAMMENGPPTLDDLERELRAQLKRMHLYGVRVDYMDHHMGAAANTPEMRKVWERVARENGLALSRYFGEVPLEGVYSVAPELKLEVLLKQIRALQEPGLYLLVCHPGLDTPEMRALTDLNPGGLANMSVHRQAVTDALCSSQLRELIQEKGIELVGYHELAAEGLGQMHRPED